MKVKDLKPWLMFGLALVFYAYESALRVSPSIMSHDLMHDFNITAAGLSNLTAFYYYIYTPMQLLVGLLMDRFGPRILLSMATLLCTIGAFIFGKTSSLMYASLGRFLMGFGSSFAFVGVLKLAANWLPKGRIAIAAGVTMAVGMIGGFFCDTVLPHWVTKFGWRSTTIGAGWFGLFLFVLLMIALRDKTAVKDQRSKLADSMAIVFSNMLNILKDRNLWVNGMIGCMMWLPIAIYAETWGGGYLVDVKGLNAEQASSVNAWVFIGWAVGGPMLGHMSDYFKKRKLLLSLGSIISAALFVVFFSTNVAPWMMGAILFLAGLAGSTQALVFAVSRDNVPSVASGSAAAFTNLLVMLAGIIQPISGHIMDMVSPDASKMHHYPAESYHAALALVPVALLISGFLSMLIKDKLVQKDAD